MHPPVPFDEKLENVPTGHGRKEESCTSLYPEVNRPARTELILSLPSTLIGSVSE